MAEPGSSLAEGAVSNRAADASRAGSSQPEHDGYTHESACLNCGTVLIGPHCHACGQHAHVHRTVGAFLHDLLHGALQFEGRIWRTLPKLLGRPGELTHRYIAGERVRFVSPMAMFLFCVFLMFAAFQIAGISAPALSSATIMDPEGIDPRAGRHRQPAEAAAGAALDHARRRSDDHAVFVTCSLSFMTLLFVALTLLDNAGVSSGVTTLTALLIPPVHIYRHMRGAYRLRRVSALWRTAALLVFIVLILLLFLNLLLMLGTFG
jgi:hypothetical protein